MAEDFVAFQCEIIESLEWPLIIWQKAPPYPILNAVIGHTPVAASPGNVPSSGRARTNPYGALIRNSVPSSGMRR